MNVPFICNVTKTKGLSEALVEFYTFNLLTKFLKSQPRNKGVVRTFAPVL